MTKPKENKSDRFRRLAEARVNKLIKMLRLLGNLSGKGNYEYTEEQLQQIFSALQTELIQCRMRFLRQESKRKKPFSLQDDLQPEPTEYHPTIAVALPDGTYLRAVAYSGGSYPCIDLYWDNGINAPTEAICFAEFNPENETDKRLCVGVYRVGQEDAVYYEPYNIEGKKEYE